MMNKLKTAIRAWLEIAKLDEIKRGRRGFSGPAGPCGPMAVCQCAAEVVRLNERVHELEAAATRKHEAVAEAIKAGGKAKARVPAKKTE